MENWSFFGFKVKFSMCIEFTRKKSEFPPWGKGKREGERIPIEFIKARGIFHPSLFVLPHGGNLDFFLVHSVLILDFMIKQKNHTN